MQDSGRSNTVEEQAGRSNSRAGQERRGEERRGMPRFRLPGRFLLTRSSSLSSPSSWESCPSCASAAAAQATGSSSSSSSSRSASWLNPSPPPSLWRSIASSSARSGQKEEEERLGRPCGIPSPTRDVRNDLILGVKQHQQVWLLGQRPSPQAPHSWGLQSFSVPYSTDTERDLHGDQEEQQLGISDLVSPDPQEREEEKEEVVVVYGEGFYSSHDSTPAAPAGDNRRSATFLQGRGEEEVTTQLDSALSTSRDADEESDVSELELVDVEDVDSQSEDLADDDGQFKGEYGRPNEEREDAQRADWALEQMPQDAAAEREEIASSELVSDFLSLVSTAPEDAREMGLIESEPDGDLHRDGLPYLHTLSVDEIREILEKARAKDVRILQVRKCCEWVDQLVFASGRSSRHLRGMADAIVYKVKQLSENVGPNSFPLVEGRDGEQWMAIDCGNIVVHLFLEEARSYYNLEEFWTKKSNPRLVETY